MAGSYLIAQKVRALLIDELNKNLLVHVDVHTLDISLWSNFPNINIRLNGLKVQESHNYFDMPAIEADQLNLIFNVFDVMKNQKSIAKIEWIGGHLRLYQKNNQRNFDFFKSSESDNNPISLDLKKIILSNTEIWFVDGSENHSLNTRVDQLTASGKFDQSVFNLRLKTQALFDHLTLSEKTVFKGKWLKADLDIKADAKNERYLIRKGGLQISELETQIQGLADLKKKYLDLTFNGKELHLNSLLSLLPNKGFAALKSSEIQGALYLKGSIKGNYGNDIWPDIDVSFGGTKVAYTGSEAPINLKNLTFKGMVIKNPSFPSGKMTLNIDDMNIGGQAVKASLNLTDFTNPVMDVRMLGSASLAEYKRLIMPPEILDWRGKIQFNLNAKILYNALEKKTYQVDYLDGDIELTDGFILFKKDSALIPSINASITGRNQALAIRSLYLESGTTDLLLKGEWKHFLNYLNAQTEDIYFNGELTSRNMNVNELMALSSFASGENTQTNESNTFVQLDLVAGNLKYDNHTLKEVKGRLRVQNENIELTEIHAKTLEGTLTGNIYWQPDLLRLQVSGNHINIKTLFDVFNDFGQNELTHENISGFLDADILYSHGYDAEGAVDLKSIMAKGMLNIKKGRLQNYATLQSLSSFIDVNELKDIRFEDLSNSLEIKNQTIIIPLMKVKNSALNLEISGSHTFQNVLDYHLKVFLSDVVAAKYDFIKRKNEKKVEKSKGGLSAYIHISGPIDNLSFKYDKKKVNGKLEKEKKVKSDGFIQTIKTDWKGLEWKTPAQKDTVTIEENIWDE